MSVWLIVGVAVRTTNAQTPCITRFTTMETTCGDLNTNSTDLYEHSMDSKAPCSTACLDAMEDLLGYTTSSNFKCRDYWNTRVTNDVDTCSRECTNLRTQSKPCLGDEAHCYPLGKRALYEGFLGKCQDQRRAIYMAALNTDPVRQPVTEDAWGNYVVEAEAEVVFSSKNSRAFVGVGASARPRAHFVA